MSSHDSSTDNGDDGSLDAVLPGGYQASDTQAAPEQLESVDQVAIRKLGGFNFITPLQWVAIGRDERMRLIKSEAVVFLSQGQEVPLRSALEYLKELADGLPHGPPPATEAWPAEEMPPPAQTAPPAERWPPPTSRPPSLVEEPLDPAVRPRERPDYRGD